MARGAPKNSKTEARFGGGGGGGGRVVHHAMFEVPLLRPVGLGFRVEGKNGFQVSHMVVCMR